MKKAEPSITIKIGGSALQPGQTVTMRWGHTHQQTFKVEREKVKWKWAHPERRDVIVVSTGSVLRIDFAKNLALCERGLMDGKKKWRRVEVDHKAETVIVKDSVDTIMGEDVYAAYKAYIAWTIVG